MSTIYNFHQISDLLACSGQPTEDQLAAIAGDGYQVIVNLGLSDAKYALADESASVTNLGLAYHHIPIAFDNPQMDELAKFISVMNRHTSNKILVHCAANYRASAFIGMYLFANDQLNEEDLQELVEEVWQPDGIWQRFIEEGIEFIKSK
jgi:protein tyrosine phosphatase (PTP) superfamily phosphohydrolase (DUF442 family)